MKLLKLAAVTLGGMLALSLPASAASKEAVPIKGSVITTFAVQSPPPVVTLLIEGAGIVSHLGNTWCWSDNETVDFTQGGRLTATLHFVSADGDELIAEALASTTADMVNNSVAFQGMLTFTGGTGRFAQATGTAEFQGGAVPATGPTGPGWFTINGHIQYGRR